MDELAIFTRALDIERPQERAAFLEQVCGADGALRARVEALLLSHEAAGNFLQNSPLAGTSPTVDQRSLEGLGTVIGPYKLLQQIGEGGMGVVYMAEQTEPIARRVALKIIKPGMDTRQVISTASHSWQSWRSAWDVAIGALRHRTPNSKSDLTRPWRNRQPAATQPWPWDSAGP